MAKTAGDVSELDKLRGETWVAHCLAVAECKTLAQLHEKVPVLSSVDLWSKYRGGKAKPLESTVRAVNLVLPRTAATWSEGPQGLRLWRVLSLDQAASRQLVETAIANQLEDHQKWMRAAIWPVSQMDKRDLIQALLELTIPWAWARPVPEPDMTDWTPPPDMSKIDQFVARIEEEQRRTEVALAARGPSWANHLDHYRSLAEVISCGSTTWLEQPYLNHRKAVMSSDAVQRAKEVEDPVFRELLILSYLQKYPILTAERAVALLAAAVVCNGSEELLLKDAAYFLTTGLKPVLQDHFGEGIAKYVEDNI